MKKFYIVLALLFVQLGLKAQVFTISSTANFLNNNGSGIVTFNFQNTNAYDIKITGFNGVTGTAGPIQAEVWFKTTPINGAPGLIGLATGWTQAAEGTITGIANTTTTVTQPFFSNLNLALSPGWK